MVRNRLDGSTTRSSRPASTVGALVFSLSSSGISASSPRQSQPVPVRYSQPRPTGGASVRMLSNEPGAPSTASAVNSGWMRTPRWRGGGAAGVGGVFFLLFLHPPSPPPPTPPPPPPPPAEPGGQA